MLNPFLMQLKAAGRYVLIWLHVLKGLWIIARHFSGLNLHQRQKRVQVWSQQMLDIIGVELKTHGHAPAPGPVLWVSNHVSWLDILIINAVQPVRFVSKADIKHWPVVGALVAGAGTLFIERRSRRDAMRVVLHMTEALREGHILAIFPEGTVGNGQGMLPFHANLLQSAIAAQTPIQPVGLVYTEADSTQLCPRPVYADGVTLTRSLWRTLSGQPVWAHVNLGEPEYATERDRRAWAQDLHQVVGQLTAKSVSK